MCSEKYLKMNKMCLGWLGLSVAALVASVVLVLSCSPARKARTLFERGVLADISIPGQSATEPDDLEQNPPVSGESERESGEPLIMNAIRDDETGEMVATDIISASKVVARFNHVPERLGNVSISFDLMVPAALLDSDWQLRFSPVMEIAGEHRCLETVNVTGAGYRDRQLRGYQRYREFLASIVTDTTDLIMMRQLELFIARYYPETYAMRRDSSIVPAPDAENLFGVTQRDAVAHYSKTLKHYVNDRKKRNRDKMFRKYVKSPIDSSELRLDTVLRASNGDFIYRYTQSFRSLPHLKKVVVNMTGSVWRFGEYICDFPSPDSLEFYISSLSSLADDSPHYRMVIRERVVRDKTLALIDFAVGKSAVDTSLGCNAEELARVRRCIGDVFERDELELDSLVVTAACSPEGRWKSNASLSRARSAAVRDCIAELFEYGADSLLRTSCLPEDWGRLTAMICSDSLVSNSSRRFYQETVLPVADPDLREQRLRKIPEYGYVRERIYPKLRTVKFDFHLHRKGMVKDTVHTAEIDTAYMHGVEALKQLDYPAAVALLRPYRDYNSALAFASAGYDHSSWDVLKDIPGNSAKVCYLKALVLSRLGQRERARHEFVEALEMDPSMRYRANLDPEMELFQK